MKPLLILLGSFIIVMTMWLTFMPDLCEPVRKLKKIKETKIKQHETSND